MKKFLAVLLVVALIMGLSVSALASGPIGQISNSDFVSFGSVTAFTSIDDDGLIPRPLLGRAGSVLWEYRWSAGTNTPVVEKAIDQGSLTLSKEFIKYLSGSWAYSNKYTWSQTNTAEWTIGGNAELNIADKVRLAMGLSRSRSTSYQAGTEIPAISSKLSKLGFASDFLFYDCQRCSNKTTCGLF